MPDSWPLAVEPTRSVLDLRRLCFPNLTRDDVGFTEERLGEAVGYLGVVLVKLHLRGADGSLISESVGGLSGLCVDPEWRGIGIGSRLVAAAEAWIRPTCMFAALFTGTPAFYERLGYEARPAESSSSATFMVKQFSYPWLPDTVGVIDEAW